MATVINNWDAAQELQRFKGMYIDVLIKKHDAAKENLDLLHKRRENCDHQQKYVKRLEGQMINFSRLHSSMLKLIAQHEDLVDKLSEMNAKWFHDISMDGVQPKEMMGIQAEMLQEIFTELNNILNPT